jgi:hypothetical protein
MIPKKKPKKPQPINEPRQPEPPDDEQEPELPEHNIPTMDEILNRRRKGE